MKALFITPHFRFYKAIPSKVQLYQMAFPESLTAVNRDDSRAVVPSSNLHIMQFMLQDNLMPNPFKEKSKVPIYKYIGIKEG